MMDRIILAPYYLVLKFRHFLFDKGIIKSKKADVPTVCFGNITVGGTGKTPHTEMLIRLLKEAAAETRHIAVLSRGYKRRSKGFQQAMCGTDAALYGDEPLQIKNKFPDVTVAVDADRVEGCDFLCHPEKLHTSKKGKKCLHKDFPAADLIILDDAFQHRFLSPSLSILLINYNRPIDTDLLLPLGRLRDLKERAAAADVIIVTKCPAYLSDADRDKWLNRLGRNRTVLFSTTEYDTPEPIFPEGDSRYIYAKRAISITGIADDTPFIRKLTDNYKLVGRMNLGDHHNFSQSDISTLDKLAQANPTAVILTTEKDSQRLIGMKNIPETLKSRMFRVPIKASMLSAEESLTLQNLVLNLH